MELTIRIPDDADRVAMLGPAERNLKLLREALGVMVVARAQVVRLSGQGAAVNRAAGLLAQLSEAAQRGRPLSRSQFIQRVQRAVAELEGQAEAPVGSEVLDVYTPGKRVVARTAGQRRYLRSIAEHDMVFCTGPAGTGKTYLAVASAVSMLKKGLARKLVLARPAVEAGEKLGFLPGDMQEKVNPYLRPLLDALYDMMPAEQAQRLMHSDLIEVVPLAFMRGRTLNEAIILCDEAQNTTRSQMLMLLTRLGEQSKMIITGDVSQIDLPDRRESGMVDAIRRLRTVPGIDFVTLAETDIVRHPLVSRIVQQYGLQPASSDRQAAEQGREDGQGPKTGPGA